MWGSNRLFIVSFNLHSAQISSVSCGDLRVLYYSVSSDRGYYIHFVSDMRRTHTPRFPCAEETEHGFSRHVGSRKETNIIKAGHQQAQGITLIAAKNNKKRGGGAARVVRLLLTNLPQSVHLRTTVATAKSPYQRDLGSRLCRIGLQITLPSFGVFIFILRSSTTVIPRAAKGGGVHDNRPITRPCTVMFVETRSRERTTASPVGEL